MLLVFHQSPRIFLRRLQNDFKFSTVNSLRRICIRASCCSPCARSPIRCLEPLEQAMEKSALVRLACVRNNSSYGNSALVHPGSLPGPKSSVIAESFPRLSGTLPSVGTADNGRGLPSRNPYRGIIPPHKTMSISYLDRRKASLEISAIHLQRVWLEERRALYASGASWVISNIWHRKFQPAPLLSDQLREGIQLPLP